MALDTSLNGIRNRLITQIHGRRLGLASGNSSDQGAHYLAGPAAAISPIEGWSAAGSTIVSTSVANQLVPYGVSVVGATGASGTTGYTLSAPVPGVDKTIFCPTSGYAVITLASGNFITTASSTCTIATFSGKGQTLKLTGLSTAWYGVMNYQNITSVTTGPQIQFS
jgi:hypothetical protein